jgi:RNA polymerase sigma factor (TIGR02999 family)
VLEREAITDLLLASGRGAPGAFDRMVELIYPELRRIARRQLLARGRPDGPVLDTTALVHEAYLKLVDVAHATVRDRAHFLAVAACAMRQVIVDHARARRAQKRGDAAPHLPLDEREIALESDAERILTVNDALERLGAADPRLLRVVECRYFAGYTEAETAEALCISTKTVARDWLRAKAWLRSAIGGPQ